MLEKVYISRVVSVSSCITVIVTSIRLPEVPSISMKSDLRNEDRSRYRPIYFPGMLFHLVLIVMGNVLYYILLQISHPVNILKLLTSMFQVPTQIMPLFSGYSIIDLAPKLNLFPNPPST